MEFKYMSPDEWLNATDKEREKEKLYREHHTTMLMLKAIKTIEEHERSYIK